MNLSEQDRKALALMARDVERAAQQMRAATDHADLREPGDMLSIRNDEVHGLYLLYTDRYTTADPRSEG